RGAGREDGPEEPRAETARGKHALPLAASARDRPVFIRRRPRRGPMPPAAPWRAWAARVIALEPPRLALGLAILLVLVSLALPLWSLGRVAGSEQDIGSFS